jgi:uncharacterized membrane protein
MKNKTFANALLLSMLIAIAATRVGAHGDEKHQPPTPTPSDANTPANSVMPAMSQDEHQKLQTKDVGDEFPNYHPLVVHFPIVLLIFAALFQIASLFVYRKEFSVATLALLCLGMVDVWLASNTFHGHVGSLPKPIVQLFEAHEFWANWTWWLALAALAAKAGSHFSTKQKWWSEAVVMILLIGPSVTVAITGHHGAELVHKMGVGPQGNFLETHSH